MEQTHEILLKIQELRMQIDRLVSDAESEKEFRKIRNAEIEKRIRDVEQWKSEIHGKIVISVAIISTITTALIAVVVKVMS